MTLFLKIFVANIVLLFVLISVHECGHWVFGRLAGLPSRRMRIRLFTFPQQVQLLDDHEGGVWVSVSNFDRYWSILTESVPSTRGKFLYVVGGFVFETVFLAALCGTLVYLQQRLFALVAVGVSLLMYAIYVLAMDLPQSRARGKPWGDTTILVHLARAPGLTVAAIMVISRLLLLLFAWKGRVPF
jgi:membrane-associated protease RseP (regulator of RpoE activity)